jgi:hypothetical protein
MRLHVRISETAECAGDLADPVDEGITFMEYQTKLPATWNMMQSQERLSFANLIGRGLLFENGWSEDGTVSYIWIED